MACRLPPRPLQGERYCKPRDDWLSYRSLVLGSNLGKMYERVLLRRVALVTRVDPLQAVGNPGVDCRHQIHLLLDTLAARAAAGLDTYGATVDITRAFPATEHELAALSLHHNGVGGHVLRAIVGLTADVAVCASVSRGCHTAPIRLGVGLLEGAVLSPRAFAAVVDGLLAALRESGLGVCVAGEWLGAMMLMDDLVILAATRSELDGMLRVVFDWCHDSRYDVALDTTHVFARLAAVDAAATPPCRDKQLSL